MRLRFLGTGTSFGIPVVGCGCDVCTSADPRDRRTRHAAILESDDGRRRILVDTPPELRIQLVRDGIDHVDAVWFTHCHADHTHGVDDLRAFSIRRPDAVPAWADEACADTLRTKFDYIFSDEDSTPEGTTRPEVALHTFRPFEAVEIAGFRILPLPVTHGNLLAFGFRVGDLGYITDAKTLPDRTLEALKGVRVLVLNALWFGKRHPTHLTVEEAIDIARVVGAERTYLTHLTHRLRHADLEARLPHGIAPAYDGLVVDI